MMELLSCVRLAKPNNSGAFFADFIFELDVHPNASRRSSVDATARLASH
jgi:hypothetical protein